MKLSRQIFAIFPKIDNFAISSIYEFLWKRRKYWLRIICVARWAAGLDVFENGNFPIPELLALDNVVMTPHTGTQTVEVRHEMAARVSRNIINFFEGGDIDKVNLV